MTSPNRFEPQLTPRQQEIYEFVRAHQPVSLQDVAEKFQITRNTAGVHLQTIRAKSMIWSSGPNRWARWHSEPVFGQVDVPDIHRVPIEQVSSIWHWAQRHAEAD